MAEPQQMNLYQKLAAIRELVEVIQRNKSGYGYNYVSEDAIMAKISVGMKKYSVSLIPNITPGTKEMAEFRWDKAKFTKDGKPYDEHHVEHIISADMTYTWVNNDNPEEKITVDWMMIGQQEDASQALGSGLSYTARYFLLKYFNIATPNDDPDEFRRRQKATEAEETKRITEAMKEEINGIIKAAIDKKLRTGAEIKDFLIRQGIKDGDFFKIKDPDTASKVLAALQAQFNEGGTT